MFGKNLAHYVNGLRKRRRNGPRGSRFVTKPFDYLFTESMDIAASKNRVWTQYAQIFRAAALGADNATQAACHSFVDD